MGPTRTARRDRTLDDRRARIVAELETEARGLDASEIGRRVGLHANTVRWHLGVLAEAGIVVSDAEPRVAPGRPRILYRLGPEEQPAGRDEYRLLATILADTLSREGGGAEACEAAGRAWGADLVGGCDRRGVEPVEEVVGILAEQGFEPEADALSITMRRCPFHDLAESRPEVVCAVHRGLINGALRELGSPLSVSSLEIFPRPDVCVARLTATGGAARVRAARSVVPRNTTRALS